jgi:DNA-binding transcriptional ArsR family regulator
MESKLKGAWIVNHANKLQEVTNAGNDFPNILLSGKCGILLTAIITDEQHTIDNKKLESYAKANDIVIAFELPIILQELESRRLISKGQSGIDILGLTPSTVLTHVADIYTSKQPDSSENAAIDLSERVTDYPEKASIVSEYISDTYHLKKDDSIDLINKSCQIGFIDSEKIAKDTLLFNGNLFRKEDSQKMAGIIESLSESEREVFQKINDELNINGILTEDYVQQQLGIDLMSKLVGIGFYDLNRILNEQGCFGYITKPSSFSRFSKTFADDAFNLAKALVSSLTYGMKQRQGSKGRIRMLSALIYKLLAGYEVGPATAIGQDYKILEMKGVVQLRHDRGSLYYMRLLKKEVGEIAKAVLLEKSSLEIEISKFNSASVDRYDSPEKNRNYYRKNQSEDLKKNSSIILSNLRKGNL